MKMKMIYKTNKITEGVWKMKFLKNILSIVLCIALLITALPLSVFAVSNLPVSKILDTGKCGEGLKYYGSGGDNLTYTFYNDGKLIIEGFGKMSKFTLSYDSMVPYQPWSEYREQITSVYVSNGITSIGENAFFGCSNLSEIYLGNTITDIGSNAFWDTEYFSNTDNWDGSVLYIGDYLIDSSDLPSKIVVKDGTKVIADKAFFDQDRLQTIVLPNSLKTIGFNAFNCADYLEKIIFNGTVEEYCNISFGDNWYFRNHDIYIDGDLATNVVIPEGVKNIQRAFDCCSSLVSVSIPSTVTNMEEAFRNCYSLKEVTIADGVKNASGFTRCSSLTSITLPDSVETLSGLADTGLQVITIGKGLKKVSSETFHNCYNLKKVYYTGDINDWCNITFESYNCTASWCSSPLHYGADLYIENKKVADVNITQVDEILGSATFYNCNSITNVKIGDTITEIDSCAFYSCDSLETVILPTNLKYIRYGAFWNCSSLKSITISDSIYKVESNAFANCGTQNLIIADGSTAISKAMVIAYSSLENVYIPKSVTEIANSAFSNRTSISDVYFSGSEVEWNGIKIGINNECLTNATIHFNSSSPEEPFFADVKFGTDSFSFGKDMSGYVGEELKAILVYTSKDENIASLNITSSNPDIVEIGEITELVNVEDPWDPSIGKDEHSATVTLKLKTEGNSTITISSPEGDSISVNVKVEAKSQITEEDKYTQLHLSFQKWYSEENITDRYGFYNQIWKDELESHQSKWWWNRLGAYRAWEIIGDAGEVCSFKFNDLTINADYYDLFLSDLILALNSNEASSKVELKSFEYYQKYNGIFQKIFKTTDEWDKSIEGYTTKKLEIEGFLLDPDYKMSDGLHNSLSKIFGEAFVKQKGTIINEVFEGFDAADQICDYITTSADIVNAFKTAYKSYIIAKSYQEVNSEFFSILENAATKMDNPKYANWFRNALNDYKKMAFSETELYEWCKTMVVESATISYDLACKKVLSNISYEFLAKSLGCKPSMIGIAVFTYNTTYMLLDKISGLSNETTPYYLMNYVAPLEKALSLVEKEYANNLKNDRTYENAVKYDCAYNLLRQTNLYLYQCAYDFSAEKSQDDDMKLISIYQDLWNKIKCHNGTTALVSNKKYTSIQCPVDVFIYDPDDDIVLSIVDEEIIQIDPSITALVCDGKKSVVYPAFNDYRIEIVGRENGIMNYYASEINNDIVSRDIEFYDLPLTMGLVYSGNIPNEFNIPNSEYTLTNNVKTYECNYDSLSTKACAEENHKFNHWEVMHEKDSIAGVEVSYCSLCGYEEKRLIPSVYSISGSIKNFNNTGDFFTIRILKGTTEIDSIETTNGSYNFSGITPSTYTLEVIKANHVTRTYQITVSNSDVIQDVEIHLIGDINGDGMITGADRTRLLRHIKGTSLLDGYEYSCADVNGDGQLTGSDSTKVLRHIKGNDLLW